MKAQELFLKKIQDDESFAKKVFDLNSSKEDVQIIAKAAGIEISFEALEDLKEQFMKVRAHKEGELSDDDLEAVAGGVLITFGFTGDTSLVFRSEKPGVIFPGW